MRPLNPLILSRQGRVWAYLQLLRPANIATAMADILAGFAASGTMLSLTGADWASDGVPLAWLLLATVGLYGGGVVFNDLFDAELDAKERPERPLPSARASLKGATLFGSALLIIGVAAAGQVSSLSALLAAAIALAALLYDAYGKHYPLFGPLNMGVCRGFNLLLGVSAAPAMVGRLWFLALIPIAYIAAITLISRGEVHGGDRRSGVIALLLIGAVSVGIFALGFLEDFRLLAAAPFLILFWALVVPRFVLAAQQPRPDIIRAAVKTGVIMLIALDATLAAGFTGLFYGLLVLALLPVSLGLARLFAVT